jgi:hypothetical protein
MDSGRMARLDLPAIRFGTGEAITQQQRITLLRRYALTDTDPLRVRAAACLMLLYAQPLSRVLRLTLTELDHQPGGQLCLRIGEPASPVPEPFAQVLLLQAAHAALTTSTWLFPGRNPGQPAAYITVFNQLRSLGFPCAPDGFPRSASSPPRLPPPSSPTPSASTTPPPTASTSTPALPGAATHLWPHGTKASPRPDPLAGHNLVTGPAPVGT